MMIKFTLALLLLVSSSSWAKPDFDSPDFSDLLNSQRSELKDFREQVSNEVSSIVDQLGFNQPLSNLVSETNGMSKSLEEVSSCFESKMNKSDSDVNIFDGETSFKNVASKYYEAFSENYATPETVSNLLESTRSIVQYCLNRTNNGDDSNRAKFGYTSLSDKSDAYMLGLAGVSLPTSNLTSFFSKREALGGDSEKCTRSSESLNSTYDWREKGVVTSVKNQRNCGSCWTFATAGSIESAYLIKGYKSDDVDLSEQQMVDCAKPRPYTGCQGGTSHMSFEYAKNEGVTNENSRPYYARALRCRDSRLTPKARVSDYCVRSRLRYSSSSQVEELSDEDIQQALVNYGPLYIAVNAEPMSKNYKGGVVDTSECSTRINHAVLLVGYTEDAWIIKNSWGPDWGEDGYFRLARGKNMCGVNTEIAYPVEVEEM